MLKRKIMIIGFLAFCLTATQLIDVTSSAEYDPWCDINDDGIIDIVDLVNLGIRFGEEGTPINKTALLLDLQERVEALENQSVPLGYICSPAYDSGWCPPNPNGTFDVYHNLGTTSIFVFALIERGTEGWAPSDSWRITGIDKIHITTWDFGYRIMIWKIQPHP